jgi:acyl carrier protein
MEEKLVITKLEPIFRKVFSNDSLVVVRELSANNVEAWDSLNHMILISEIEKNFTIKFKLKDLNKMGNVGDMIDIIISKL